jgi:glycosyltransferase involved in cell wall biosynthesis
MARQKILFLITKSNWGGGQRYVYDLATSLNRDQYDIVVALGGDGELYQNLIKAGIRVIQINGLQRDVSFKQEIKAGGEIAKIIRAEKPDILHVNSSKAGAIGSLLGRFLGVKLVVFTALGWAFNENRPGWQKFLIKIVHWLTVLLAHKTIALSSGVKEQMNWPGVQNKIFIVHLGRHVTSLATKDEARQTMIEKATAKNPSSLLGNFQNDIWIGSLSELHPIKQLPKAVAAVATLVKDFPRLRYVMIGEGQQRAELETQITNLGMQEHIFPIGAIFEAGRFLTAFDIFVFPSRSEAFGYVLLEAGAAGVPVVSTKVGGILDVVNNEETGLLVNRDSTEELTLALKRLLTDNDLRGRLAIAHQERSKTFTIEKMVSETLKLYA